MDIQGFYNTLPGNYITQVFVHSLITALIIDGSIAAWKIDKPDVRLRMRLLVIILPVLMFPMYQIINPDRGSAWFRLDALFDSARWLNIEIWGFSGALLFSLFMLFTSLVFLFQELMPVLRHSIASRDARIEGELPEEGSAVSQALSGLAANTPEVLVINDDDLMLFSSTGSRPAILVSTGLAKFLTVDELRAAIAHEMGHLSTGKRPLLVVLFLFRILQFYNPVTLMEFRRVVQEEEKICDDYAVALTGSPHVLAGVLAKFSEPPDPAHEEAMGIKERLIEYSHTALIESRIARLEQWSSQNRSDGWPAFVFALLAALVINYFVV